MFDVFGELQKFLKFDRYKIDNNVFRLHYKGTVLIMACASLLVTTGQYIGDPIDCIVDGIPGGMMDTYCWIHSTFSVPARCVNITLKWDGLYRILVSSRSLHMSVPQKVRFRARAKCLFLESK